MGPKPSLNGQNLKNKSSCRDFWLFSYYIEMSKVYENEYHSTSHCQYNNKIGLKVWDYEILKQDL